MSARMKKRFEELSECAERIRDIQVLDALQEIRACWQERDARLREGIKAKCYHERLNEDGQCRACGMDCRGAHA